MGRVQAVITGTLIFAFWGGVLGAAAGAVGGLFDRGSVHFMLPHGSVAWALFCGILGVPAGAVVGLVVSLARMFLLRRGAEKDAEDEG